MNKSKPSGTVFLLLFGIFWCSIVGVMDYLMGRTFIRQLAATSYPQTTATILSSEVERHRGSKSTTHGVKVRFKYRVGDNEFVSDKYSYDQMKSSDSGWAYKAVRENPPGAERVCYYNPKNPSEAILKPGIDGSHLFILMFMTPFNVIGLGLIWHALFGWLPEKEPKPRATDRIRGTESYAMTSWTPLGAFVGTFAIGSFLGIFLIAFPFGFHPSLNMMFGAWGTIALLAVINTISAKRKMDSGKNDLVIDKHAGAVKLPAMHKRETPVTLRFNEIQKFEPRTIESGSGKNRKTEHQVFLVQRNGSEWLLKTEYTEERAEALARTLEKRIGLYEPLL